MLKLERSVWLAVLAVSVGGCKDHTLHDSGAGRGTANAAHRLRFRADPEVIAAGEPATLSFALESGTGDRIDLAPVNGKAIHLIAVSNDLGWFTHLHPEQGKTAAYEAKVSFPSGGAYTLFADFQPAGGAHRTDKLQVSVAGKTAPAAAFSHTRGTAKAGDFEVVLEPEGGRYLAGGSSRIIGVVKKHNVEIDVNSLDDYLEAKAHMVIVGLRDKDYLHVHPGIDRGRLALQTEFKAPGLYRGWLQFQADGKLHTADFDFNVAGASVPPDASARPAHEHSH